MNTENAKLVSDAEAFISKYATLAESYYTLPLVLWAIGTHTYETFDTFPYMVITAFTKRSGKTRLMELVQPLSANGRTFSPDSPSSMYRALDTEANGQNEGTKPSMFLDEAEKLNQENHPAREFLNKGYRQGQTITRTVGEVKDFDCFCPKCFVLIGDVYDTLKDRSIVVVMRRRTPVESASANVFRFRTVKEESESLRARISEAVKFSQPDIISAYDSGHQLEDFMNDRDAEIWQSIFAICKAFCPERLQELTQTAVDMCMEKSAPERKSTGIEWAKAEAQAENEEARVILLRDMLKLCEDGREMIPSSTVIDELKAIPTSQWRKFRGTGLTNQTMGFLLDSMNVSSKVKRIKGTSGSVNGGDEKSTVRGYMVSDLKAAGILCGLIAPDSE